MRINKLYIIIILTTSIFIHFLFFGTPNQVVFDEVHYGKHVNDYLNGTFHFDGHPPLGRMSVAGFAKLMGYQENAPFENIGEKYPNRQYLILRFLPTLAGALVPLIIFLIMLELGISPFVSLAGGLMLTLENGFLTQSRLLLMDGFLLLYGFTALLFYLKYRNKDSGYLIILAGIFAGLAFAVKWVGLSFLGLFILVESTNIIPKIYYKGLLTVLKSAKIWLVVIALTIIPFTVYFSIVMLYSSILNKSGTGDAFMSSNYQKTLEGNQYQDDPDIKTPNMFLKFVELNKQMYTVNQNLNATHPYSSLWYTWPLMRRPIYYWVDSSSPSQTEDSAKIYFIGNPVVWWFSSAAVFYGLWLLLHSLWQKLKKNNTVSPFLNTKLLALIFAGYFLNLLPYIGIKRIMFLYHYLSALIFAIITLCLLADKFKNGRKLITALLIASAIAFIFFSPLNYGLGLSTESHKYRIWFSSWQ